MRNIIKKIKMNIACVLTSLLLVVSPVQTPIIVQAAEPQFGSSTVTYTVDDYFCVQIPETINVGIQSEIYAYETNIAPEKSIYDSSQEINVFFEDEAGNQYSSQNNLIAQFGQNTNHESQHVVFNTRTDANPMNVSAGSYSGQVYFSMVCE